jgi:hypothetical protein
MDFKNVNKTIVRDIKSYKKIKSLCFFNIKEIGIIDIIFLYSMNNKDVSYVCKKLILPKKWIRKNKNFINWRNISSYQNISIDFIKEHKAYINFERLFEKNQFIRNDKNYCDLYEIYNNYQISSSIIPQ